MHKNLPKRENREAISHGRLLELLEYDPQSGVFTWRCCRYRSRVGTPAGTLNDRGYIKIKIDGRAYAAHQLAWYYVHRVWPDGHLDHIDGVGSHNGIKNLREATPGQNQQNRAISRNNTSGFPGIYWEADRGKWRVSITVNGTAIRVGRFKEKLAAIEAMKRAKAEHHTFHPTVRLSADGEILAREFPESER